MFSDRYSTKTKLNKLIGLKYEYLTFLAYGCDRVPFQLKSLIVEELAKQGRLDSSLLSKIRQLINIE